MRSYRYCFILTIVFDIILLSSNIGASQAHSLQARGQLQLFFYSTDEPLHFIVVEKKYQKLKLFEQKDSLKMLKEFTCATGENPGTKKASGDARTPEGIYYITEIYEDKRITVFGSRAFHLDYPNIFDRQAGHVGDGIFIHGTNKKLIPNSTNGCITLNNTDLDELAPYLSVHTIPVIILDSESEFLLDGILLPEKNSHQFKEILDKLAFDSMKTPIENIKTLSYLKRQEQIICSINYKIFEDKVTQYNERKRSYLTQSPTGNWRTLFSVQTQDTSPTILALHPVKNEHSVKINELSVKTDELIVKNHNPPPTPQLSMAKTNMPEAKKTDRQRTKTNQPVKTLPTFDKSDELLAFVEKWRVFWTAKDIEAYMNCYSPSFQSGNLNKDQWRTKKIYLNHKYKYINVTLRNVVIEWTPSGADVSFQQTYKSDQLQTSGTKTLRLVNRKNRWMIENEIM
ncbi:MAG: L,D-transpeptidase [Pseudomonadota bacterium]